MISSKWRTIPSASFRPCRTTKIVFIVVLLVFIQRHFELHMERSAVIFIIDQRNLLVRLTSYQIHLRPPDQQRRHWSLTSSTDNWRHDEPEFDMKLLFFLRLKIITKGKSPGLATARLSFNLLLLLHSSVNLHLDSIELILIFSVTLLLGQREKTWIRIHIFPSVVKFRNTPMHRPRLVLFFSRFSFAILLHGNGEKRKKGRKTRAANIIMLFYSSHTETETERLTCLDLTRRTRGNHRG